MPSTNSRDPGSPLSRLRESEKQLTLAIADLHEESEHVDPDPVSELESALQAVRDARETLEEQARVTETELRGGE